MKNVMSIISLNGVVALSNFCDRGRSVLRQATAVRVRPTSHRPRPSTSDNFSRVIGLARQTHSLYSVYWPRARCHRRRSFRASKKVAAVVPHLSADTVSSLILIRSSELHVTPL